jgi:HK97 family phage prohead protease
MTSFQAANEQMGMAYRDVWSTAMINDMPDSSFLYIEPGGSKDADGKTTPRSLRHFPVKDANGKPDAAHIANALARINQADIPVAARMAAMTKAKAMAAAHPAMMGGPTSQYQGTAGSGRSAPTEVLTRSFDVDLMLRAGGDGRTLVGRAVPYGQTIDVNDGRERFLSGAFARQIDANQVRSIKLHATHEGRRTDFAVGKTLTLEDRPDGLHGTWGLYDTPRGDEALYMVRTGEVTGLSVGFKALANGTRIGPDGAMERTAVHLDHVALATEPAYPEARILAVRSVEPGAVAGLRTAQARHHQLLDRIR